jgi:hypothetical protein
MLALEEEYWEMTEYIVLAIIVALVIGGIFAATA